MMREIDVKIIEDKIAELCIEANHYLGNDLKSCISRKLDEESQSSMAKITGGMGGLGGLPF